MDLMIISILGFYLFEYQIYNISYFIIYLIVGWIVVAVFIHFTMSIVLQHLLKFFKNSQARRSVSLIVIAFFPFSKQYAFSEKQSYCL
jgi:putative colanic acid biosynthesis UDP-glucose lipid carrier transferase